MAPCLRKDLVATPSDEQGVACVEVVDPASHTAFRFYDFEYELAQQLTGQPLEDVVAWARDTYQIDLSAEALDQFLEKLAGLGFLEGGSSGAQPAILAPFSPSSGSQPFGAVATSPVESAVDAPRAPWKTPLARPTPLGTPVPVDAAAPAGLISGDATEYRLRDAGSGLWDTNAADTAVAPRSEVSALPNLQALAEPLPPVAGSGYLFDAGSSPASAAEPVSGQSPGTPLSIPAVAGEASKWSAAGLNVSVPVRWPPPDLSALEGPSPYPPPRAPARADSSAPVGQPVAGAAVDTPLASIAQAIAASIVPAATDAPEMEVPDRTGAPVSRGRGGDLDEPAVASPVPELGVVPPPAGLSGPSTTQPTGAAADVPVQRNTDISSRSAWARDLAEAVDQPRADRRQPPPPEVVVMPPMADPPAVAAARHAPSRRRSYVAPALLLLLAAASGAVWFLRPQPADDAPPAPASSAEAAPTVHVVSPQPTTFYRWFEVSGLVTPGRDEVLAFRATGRLQDAMPPGTTFAAGETIARLRGVAERELAVNRLRSRIAFYEQLRDSSRAEGAEVAAQQAEAKLAVRRQELATAQAAQSEWEIRPRVPGAIAELLIPKGALIKAGVPVFRVRAAGPRALFPLSAEDAARARALGFCRVETVPGTGGAGGTGGGAPEAGARAIDCAFSAVASGNTSEPRLAVDLMGANGVVPGMQVRLASARYDGVFPVPRSGLAREGGVDHVWIVSGGGRFAERRTVEIVGTVDDLGLVAHGIAVGDAVIVDPPATLKGGAEINVAR